MRLPRSSRISVLLRRIGIASSAVMLLVAGLTAPARAGETPPDVCRISVGHSDYASDWCQTGSALGVYGGSACKPMIDGAVWATRFGTIPPDQGCCSSNMDNALFTFGLRAAFRSAPGLRPTATSVPVVAYLRSEMAGGASGNVRITFPGMDETRGFNSLTPSFRDTIRGQVDVAAMMAGPAGVQRAQYSAGAAMLTIGSMNAQVCNTDPKVGRVSQVIIDPFIEVDPASPLASQFVIEKETAPGSGTWVEMKRDSATVSFTEVTTPDPADTTYTTGLAWGDYDGDGDLDLYVARHGWCGNKLYRNDDGVLVDVTTPVTAQVAARNMDVSWADVDNDGDLDLLLTRGLTTLKSVLLRNDGVGNFTVDSTTAMSTGVLGRGIGWADFDRDGDLDLYMANCTSGGRLFRNDGTGGFTDVTPAGMSQVMCTHAGLWADYDSDGDMDLFILNRATASMLFRNDNGTFVNVTGSSQIPVGNLTTAYAGTWVDYDDDGAIDLYISTDSQNRLFHNNGDGTFADSTEGWTAYAGMGSGVAWGDLDLDGDLDAYLTKRDLPNRVAVRFDGHFGTSMFHVGGPVDERREGHSVGWADYDGDGDLDLYLGYKGSNKLLRNDQAVGNHWLQVDLRGIQSNRFGVGAAVRVVAGGHAHHRQVLSNTGFWGGNPLRQTFGLEADAQVDSLVVRWPSGVVTALAGPFDADRRVTVHEDGVVAGVESAGLLGPRPRLLGSAPNPFGRSAAVRFMLPRAMPVAVSIYDVAGRRVRRIQSAGSMPAGVGELAWDGRSEAGEMLRSGVFFCRLDVPGAENRRGMVFKMTKVE
jgi:hypothetical protein